MPGRGPQTFKKRQKEQQRKERQMEKMAKRLGRKDAPPSSEEETPDQENITEGNPHEVTSQEPVRDTPDGSANAH